MFYKAGLIFLNKQEKNKREDVTSITSSEIKATHNVTLTGNTVQEVSAFDNTTTSKAPTVTSKEYKISELDLTVVKKALQKLVFYRFNNLKVYFPNLKSTTELITSNDYLGDVRICVNGENSRVLSLNKQDTLSIVVEVLDKIAKILSAEKKDVKGTTKFEPHLLKDVIYDKTLHFAIEDNADSDKEFGKSMKGSDTKYFMDLSVKNWYAQNDCYGTSEEKALIQYIDSIQGKLKSLYSDIYLVRNERHFKIYAFDDGRPTEPDFVLFLFNEVDKKQCQYQIFIEPKGSHLLKEDKWKEDFLKSIHNKGEIEQLWSGSEYNIWGMPFFNKSEPAVEKIFKDEFEKSFLR